MSEPVFSVDYAVTEEGYVAVNMHFFWAHYRKLLPIYLLVTIIGLLLANVPQSAGSTLTYLSHITGAGLLGAAIGGGLLRAISAVFISKQARVVFSEQKLAFKPTTMNFFTDYFTAESFALLAHCQWNEVWKWDKTGKDLIILINSAMFCLIPLNLLGTDGTTFVLEKLIAGGLPTPGRKRAI